MGVPRLFEKIQDKIMASLDSLHGLKKKLITWARGKSSNSVARKTLGYVNNFGCLGNIFIM